MANEITLPVKLQLDNLQSIAKDMRSQLGNLKIGSTGYEKLSKVIADIEKRIENLQVLSSRPFVDVKQFNELQKEILHAKDDLTKLSLEAGKIKFSDISLTSEQSNKLKEFDNQLKTINDSLKEIKDNAKTAFLQSDVGKAWKEANPTEATKSFEVITRKIEEEVNKQETAIARAKKAYDEYLNTTQTNDKYKTKINGALRNGTSLTDILKEQNLLNKVFSSNGNRFANNGRQILKDWLQDQFGLSQEAINSIVSGAGDKVYKAFSEMQENVKKTLRTERNRINNENKNLNAQTNNGKTFTDDIATAEANKASAEAAQKSANQVNLESIEIQKQLQTQYEETKEARDNYTQSIVRSAQESASMPQQTEKIRQGLKNVGDSADEASTRFQKFDSVVSKLSGISNFINRYIGAYAIMRKVVTAIRNAFTNIKELDQTITNIAVVTNMSQEDLWGKIGEYTEKAQQYGVATKDVYTVSQLFYQQGLQTNQVMSLTTETLKMAKIAGMEYGDAANAMTVAIRAFNIEMSQAQQVTDTYSALAAKFAVSSAEIANAMEKTASSAANVGMSVQSTSAFMSVMIQTTRESAQNIGSALKSIISRYGEMKASPQSLINVDGEEVAFNKVDTALQSIGISIKDASGQFRDFDDVIMELAGKWNTLDNNTQRYIATIMAGNRQQSRFIALVSNSEELTRAMSTANNAENASIIQVAKTMDSLETKAQQLKNAFSQLYLDLHIEEGLKNIYDILTRIISTIGKLGTLKGVLPTLINLFTVGPNVKKAFNSTKEALNNYKKKHVQIAPESQQEADAFNEKLAQPVIKKVILDTDGKLDSQMNSITKSLGMAGIKSNYAKSKLNDAIASGQLKTDEGIRQFMSSELNMNPEDTEYENHIYELLQELGVSAEQASEGLKKVDKASGEAAQATDEAKNSEIQKTNATRDDTTSTTQHAGHVKTDSQATKQHTQQVVTDTIGGNESGIKGKLKNILGKQFTTKGAKIASGISVAGSLLAPAITAIGANIQDKSSDTWEGSKIVTGFGNALSGASTGFSIGMMTGNPVIAGLAAAVGGALSGLGAIIDGFTYDLKERYNNAKKELKSLQDDQLKKDAKAAGLKESIDNIVQLRKAMYDSKEDMQAYKEAMNNVGKEYPELITRYDEQGNAIVDLTKAENTLTQARIDAANAAIQASGKQVYVAERAQEATGNAASSAQWLVERAESISTNTKDDSAIQKYAGEIDKILADYKDNEELFGGITSGAELIGKSKGTKTSDLSLDEFKRLRNLLYDIYHAKGGELSTAENSAARNLITKNILSATSGYDPEMRRNIQESDSFNELAYQYAIKRVNKFDNNTNIVNGEDLYKFSQEHDESFEIISGWILDDLLNNFMASMSSKDRKNFLSLDYSNFSRPEQLAKYLNIDNFDLENNLLHQALAEQVNAANQEQIDWINNLVYNQGNISGVDNLNENLKGIQKLTYENKNGEKRNTAGDLAWLFNTPGENKLLGKYSGFISEQITEANSLAEEGYTVLAQSRLDALYKMGLELYKLDDTFQVELYDTVSQIDFSNYDTIIDAQKKLEEYDKAHTEIDLLPMINNLSDAASNILFNVNTLSQTVVSKVTEASKDIDNIISTNQSGLSFDKALEEFNSLEVSSDNINKFSDAFTFDSSLKKYVYTVNGLEAAISQKENSLQKDIDKASETLEAYKDVLSLGENENNFDIDQYENKEAFIDSINTKQFSDERVKHAYQELAIKYYDQYKNGIKNWSEFLEAQIKNATEDFDFANIIKQEYEANQKNQWFEAIDWSAILLDADFSGTNKALMGKLAESLGMQGAATEDIINKYFETTYSDDAARAAAIEAFNKTIDEGKISKYQAALGELLGYQSGQYLSEATKQISKTLKIDISNIEDSAENSIHAAAQFLNTLANEIGKGSYTLEQYNQDAQSVLDKTLAQKSQGKSLLDFASGDINSGALNSLAQTLGQKLTDIVNVETGEFKNAIFDTYLDYDAATNTYKITSSFEEFVEALNRQYGNVIDTTSIQYIEALNSWNDTQIENQNKFKDNLLKQVESIGSAKSGDMLNITYLYNLIGDDLNQILLKYGAEMKEGVLTIQPGAQIQAIYSTIIDELEKTGQLSAQEVGKLKDSLISLFTNITSLISSGISGSLSNEGFAQLSEWASTQGIASLDFVETADGLKLAQHSAIELYNALKDIDSLKADKVFQEISESLQETNGYYKSISTIENRIVELRKLKDTKDPTKKKQYEEELALAEQIKAVRSTSEDDSFNFMSNEIPAAQKNPLNYLSNWSTAWSTITESAKSGYMDYTDFYNIITEMGNIAQKSGTEINLGAGQFVADAESAADLIRQGAAALSIAADGSIKVDLSKIGTNFMTSADGMADGIDEGIKEIAKSQIKMLDGMIQLMETVVAMQKLGNVDIDANNKLDLNEMFNVEYEDDGKTIKAIHDFTQTYRDAHNELINWAKTDEGAEFKKTLEAISISWNGADENMWSLLNKEEEDVKQWSDELKGQYAALVSSLYAVAMSGDFDLDKIFDSIKQVFAESGFEGEIPIGDAHLVFKYNTSLEKGKDGKYHIGDKEFPGTDDGFKKAVSYQKATELKALQGIKSEQGKDGSITFEHNFITNADYNVETGTYNIKFKDGSTATATSKEGASLAIATYAEMTHQDVESVGAQVTDAKPIEFTIQQEGYANLLFTVKDGKTEVKVDGQGNHENLLNAKHALEKTVNTVDTTIDEQNNVDVTFTANKEQAINVVQEVISAVQDVVKNNPISLLFTKMGILSGNQQQNSQNARYEAEQAAARKAQAPEAMAQDIADQYLKAKQWESQHGGIVQTVLEDDAQSTYEHYRNYSQRSTNEEISQSDQEVAYSKAKEKILNTLMSQLSNDIKSADSSKSVDQIVDSYLETYDILNSNIIEDNLGQIIESIKNKLDTQKKSEEFFKNKVTDEKLNAAQNERDRYLQEGNQKAIEENYKKYLFNKQQSDAQSARYEAEQAAAKKIQEEINAEIQRKASLQQGAQNARYEAEQAATKKIQEEINAQERERISGEIIEIQKEIDYYNSVLENNEKSANAAQAARGTLDMANFPNYVHKDTELIPTKQWAELSSFISGSIDVNVILEKLKLLQEELKNKQIELDNIPENTEEDEDIDKNNRRRLRRNEDSQPVDTERKSLTGKLKDKAHESVKNTEDQDIIDFDAVNSALKEMSDGITGTSKDITTSSTNIISTINPLVEIMHRFGEEAETAMGHVSKFGELAGGAEHPVDELGSAAATATGQVTSLGGSSDTAAGSLNGLSGAAAAAAAALGNIQVNVSVNVSGGSPGGTSGDSNGSTSNQANVVPDAKGTIGLANAKGTLMGELGPELVVSNGRYFVVGQTGPEMVDLAPDAIVFNHLQTKSLLEKGTSPGRGKAITNERTATAYATGSIHGGPAKADAQAALNALIQLRAEWQALLSMSVKDFTSKGSTGGGGGDSQFIKDVERWYNWLQKIAQLEKDINYQESLRSRIASDFNADGYKYYQSQKQSLKDLTAEISTQKDLLDSQKEYFEKRREEVNAASNPFSQFYTIDEYGQLKYTDQKFSYTDSEGKTHKYEGGYAALAAINETDVYGNKVHSTEEQLAMMKKFLGEEVVENYLKDESGNERDDAAVLEEIWSKMEGDQSEFQGLHDSITDLEKSIEDNITKQNEILKEMEDNQISVENRVYDAIVDMRERTIEEMQNERDAIEKTNTDLIQGLSDALSKERELYNNSQNDKELTTLQRQLAILQRSGGSAAEISNLQSQIDSKQQDIYFDRQQQEIDALQEASDAQLERLDRQIELEEEALEYEKAHGLLWDQVYQVMAKTPEEITSFITENNSEFWSKSETSFGQDVRQIKFEAEQWKAFSKDGDITTLISSIEAEVTKESKAEAEKKSQTEGTKTEEGTQPVGGKKTDGGKTDHGGVDHYQYNSNDANTHRKIPVYKDGWTGTGSNEAHSFVSPGSGNRQVCKLCGYYIDRDVRVRAYDNGGIITEDQMALVHANESVLTPEQTAILRNDILGSKPNSLMNLLMDFRNAYAGLGDNTYNTNNTQGGITFEHAEVNVHVDKLANGYDAARAGDDIMKEMLNIARKTSAQNRIRR